MTTRALPPTYDGSTPLPNQRHELFCRFYTGDHRRNAAASYKAAGYKTEDAKVCGCRLLTNVNVRKRIDYLNKQELERIKLHQRDATERLAAIATVTLADFMDSNGQLDLDKVRDPALAPAVESLDPIYDKEGCLIGHKLRLRDPLKALELLGLTAKTGDTTTQVNQVLVIRT